MKRYLFLLLSFFALSLYAQQGSLTGTAIAASDKEHKPILTGINFKAANNQLECTATDSYRLAKKIIH